MEFTNRNVHVPTPWGVTGVWMRPKPPHPVYSRVNPFPNSPPPPPPLPKGNVHVPTPWGVTGVWMRPKPPHPVYSRVNPFPNSPPPPPPPLPKGKPRVRRMSIVQSMRTVSDSFPIEVPPHLMRLVVGKKGCHFKQLLHNVPGAAYIWYNRSNQTVEIWAMNSKCLEEMKHVVRRRMKLVRSD
jgi:hypothetical protein